MDSTCKLHFAGSEVKLVKATNQYVYDEDGKEYLDCASSSATVGHCNPHVVASGIAQMSQISTCHGFLHESQLKYIERLQEILPAELQSIFLVNSGSEANDLALRLIHQHSKRVDVAVFEDAYCGNTSSLTDLSPKMFKRLPQGKKEWVHIIPLPVLRNHEEMSSSSSFETKNFCQTVQQVLEKAQTEGHPIGGFMSEIIITAAGVVVPPKSYYQEIYQLVRQQGGLCVAIENQTGLGRTGHMWAFEAYDVLPDIITVGKPLGGGFPLAAVATTKTIADSLGDYINTFGGNPVMCSVGIAVLDVITNENLVQSAENVGKFVIQGLRELMPKYNVIGDVRGMGLCIGIEIVCNRSNMKPAKHLAERLLLRLRKRRIVVATQGTESNIISITPPLCFTRENGSTLIDALDKALINLDCDEEERVDESSQVAMFGEIIPISILHGLLEEDEEDDQRRGTKRTRAQYENEMD